ncbi:NAD(P)H-binding protein [Vibrio sonorensis]|uniref:NAD(P)H-binding protein n=1 Tax=Vibrio sonorensis TaxID=1004316 RepID=UPI0008D9E56A|nr:NAD(P)H-binding protein [Vibrio sonorensis]
MDIKDNKHVAMIAGATGLVGNELIKQLLEEDAISHVYALTRKPLPYFHSKLESIQTSDLSTPHWHDENANPDIGFICLGTTLKQAGSKKALFEVDCELVCNLAKQMKQLGVKRLAVVSSLGASHRSFSHYLRCKGQMENTIKPMGFDQVTFVRPGPLKGLRDIPRADETVVQMILKLLHPIMIGKLANFNPIEANDVARAMLLSNLTRSPTHFVTLSTIQIRNFIHSYA